MSRPTAREFAQARDKGAQSRRNGGKATDNPWAHAASEGGRILRDAWDDAFYAEHNSPRRR